MSSDAFTNSKKLIWVELFEGLVHIGEKAFGGCTSLEYIKIPSGVNEIPLGAFQDCEGLIEVEFHDRITVISESAF